MEVRVYVFILLCFAAAATTTVAAFLEEPSSPAARSDGGFCGRILRAQTQGTRRDGYHEFRLRVDGDPESYQPGNTYRVILLATSPAYFRGFTLIALKEGREGTAENHYAGQFQVRTTVTVTTTPPPPPPPPRNYPCVIQSAAAAQPSAPAMIHQNACCHHRFSGAARWI
ncbi:hypothetical protein CRUP_011763 [Coryphaenoides rupestris]|nr:hypothetical protein CRUP_011763 [Coryphaenoides rupestris]